MNRCEAMSMRRQGMSGESRWLRYTRYLEKTQEFPEGYEAWKRYYEPCADPRCRHYIIEHSFGQSMETVYSRKPEDVGQIVQWDIGCMNADCPCEEFKPSLKFSFAHTVTAHMQAKEARH